MLELGIKIDSANEFKKVETAIDKWLVSWQAQLDKVPLKLKFDKKNSHGFKELEDKSTKSLDSISEKINALRKEFRTLTPENMEFKGDRIINEFQRIKEEAGKYGGTLDKAAQQTVDATESMVAKLKDLNRQWNELSVAQRRGSEGGNIIQQFDELTASAADYGGSLKSVAEQHKRLEGTASYASTLRGLNEEWNNLTAAQRSTIDGNSSIIQLFIDLEDTAGKYTKTLKQAADEVRRFNALTPAEQSMKGLEAQWETLDIENRRGAAGQKIIKNYQDIQQSVSVYSGGLKDIVRAEERITKEKVKQTDSFSHLKSLAMNYLSVYGSIRLIKSMVAITGELEMQRVSLDAMLQDARKGEIIMKQIKELAIESPFKIMDLISYSKQLAAFSVPYAELFDTTKRLADVSAGLGVDMSRIILAYGQVRSASVLRGMELRQFTEAGIPLISMLSKKFEELNGRVTTTGDIFDKIQRRQIPFEMIKEVFIDMTSEGGRFYEMQEKQAATLKGSIKNLADSYDVMMNEIGSGNSEFLKSMVSGAKWLMSNYNTVLAILSPVIVAVGTYHSTLILVSAYQKMVFGKQALSGLVTFTKGILTLNRATQSVGASMMKATSASAWGSLLAILGLVVATIVSIVKNTKDLVNTLDKIKSEEAGSYAVNITGFQDAMRRLSLLSAKSEKYRDTISEINRRFGEFFNDQLTLADSFEEVEEKVKGVTDAMAAHYKNLTLERGEEKIEESFSKQIAEERKNLSDYITKMLKTRQGGYDKKEIETTLQLITKEVSNLVAQTGKDIEELGSEIDGIVSKAFDAKDLSKTTKYGTQTQSSNMGLIVASDVAPFSEVLTKELTRYAEAIKKVTDASTAFREEQTVAWKTPEVFNDELLAEQSAYNAKKQELLREDFAIGEEGHNKYSDAIEAAERKHQENMLSIYTKYGREKSQDAQVIKQMLDGQLSEWGRQVEAVIGRKGGDFLRITPTDYTVIDYIRRVRDEYDSLKDNISEYSTLSDQNSKDMVKSLQVVELQALAVAQRLGFSLVKETNKTTTRTKKIVDTFLKDIASDVEEYKTRFNIWSDLQEGLSTKLKYIKSDFDFKTTFDGEPNLVEYLKKQMKAIAKSADMQIDLDVNFLSASLEDVLGKKPALTGKESESERESIEKTRDAYESLAGMLSSIRDIKVDSQKELDTLLDDYKGYSIGKIQIDEEYTKKRADIFKATITKDLSIQEIKEREKALNDMLSNLNYDLNVQLDELKDSFIEKQSVVTDFVESLVTKSLEQMRNLLISLQSEMVMLNARGGTEEEKMILQAQVDALKEELKNSKTSAAASAPKKVQDAYTQWRKLNEVLSRVNKSFSDISSSTSGTTKEILDLAGALGTSTIDMVTSIETLGKMSAEAVSETGEAASKAMSNAEKASVVLALLAAAFKVIVSIYNFLGKTDELSQKQIDTFKSYVDVTNEMVNAQKELMNTMAGADIVRAYNQSTKMIKSQTIAIREMGKAWLSSGSGNWSHSYGYRIREDLKGFSKDFARIGINFDSYDKQLTGIMNLTVKQIKLMKLEMPEAWAALGSELQDYLNQIEAADKASTEMLQSQKDALTSTTFDGLLGGLDDYLLAFDKDNKRIAENFEEYMLQAMLSITKADFLSGALKGWQKEFAAYMEDGNLTLGEKEKLRDSYSSIANEAKTIFDNMLDAAGIKDSSSNLTGIAKGIGSASEDSILILAGYADSIRFKMFPYMDYMQGEFKNTIALISLRQAEHINHARAIEINTKVTADSNTKMLETMLKVVSPSGSRGAFAFNVNT